MRMTNTVEKRPQTPMDKLSDEQKRNFYLSLTHMNYLEATKALGWGGLFANDESLRAVGRKLYMAINPQMLGISNDAVELVKKAIEERRSRPQRQVTEQFDAELLDPTDTAKLITTGKNKAAILLNKKMDRLMGNKKLLDQVTLPQLATAFGILFDKSQILRGEATENIAVMAKIDRNMTAEESLDALLKMREIQQEEKHESQNNPSE